MFDWLEPKVWEEARATGTALVALVALGFAGRTYALNSRGKREEQARLVYSQTLSLQSLPPGSDVELPEDDDAHLAVHRVAWRFGSPLEEDAVLAAVEIHNRSKEVIGPINVRLAHSDQDWTDSPGFTLQALSPDSSARVFLLGKNELPFGTPVLFPIVLFRDSAGKWWRRKGTNPIQRVEQEPRLAVTSGSFSTAGFNAVALGTGFKATHISSRPARWFFGAAEWLPGLRWVVRRGRLREGAERHALKRDQRALEVLRNSERVSVDQASGTSPSSLRSTGETRSSYRHKDQSE